MTLSTTVRPITVWSALVLLALVILPDSTSALHRPRENSGAEIHYELRVDPQRSRRLSVRITVPCAHSQTVEFAIPAWTPGYYQILHYENAIEHVRAQDETERLLVVSHPSARLWSVALPATPGKLVSLTYDVITNDKGLGFFGSALDARRQAAYVNGASAFMYVPGLTQSPTSLSLFLPANWKCATPLRSPASSVYKAATYDEMVDSPLQLGLFRTFGFQVGAVPFECVVVGDGPVNAARVSESLARVAREAIGIFGSAAFDKYIFYYHIGEAGFVGGLEHHSSTVIHLDDPIADASDDEFLTTSAHELFHAWNVKRLRPVGLGPFDYSQIVRTPSLWFAEGVTDYYADLVLVRAGLRSRTWFAAQIAQRIQLLDNTPSRARVSLETASRQAWEGQSEGFDGLSYYVKGSLVGFYFDLRLRSMTDGARGLDDVLRELERDYGDKDRAYPESALLQALNHVSGSDLTAEYNRCVNGAGDLPWDDVLANTGFVLHRQADGHLGLNFEPEPPRDDTDDRDETDRAAIVHQIEIGYPAAKMDLRAGDRIVTIDGRRVNYSIAGAIVRSLPAAVPIHIVIERHGRTLELIGEAGAQYSHETLAIAPDNMQTPAMRRIIAGLFASGGANSPISVR